MKFIIAIMKLRIAIMNLIIEYEAHTGEYAEKLYNKVHNAFHSVV